MSISKTALILAILTLVTVPTTLAADDGTTTVRPIVPDEGWQLRFYTVQVEGNSFEPFSYTETNGSGLGVSGAYRFSRRMEIELSALAAGQDRRHHPYPWQGNYYGDDPRDGGSLSLLAGLNFHVTPRHAIDFYLGPVAGMVAYDDPFERDSVVADFGIGLNMGIDVPFGKARRWSFNASVKGIGVLSDVDFGQVEDFSYVTLGAGYRF